MARRLRDSNPDLDPPGFLPKEYDVVSGPGAGATELCCGH